MTTLRFRKWTNGRYTGTAGNGTERSRPKDLNRESAKAAKKGIRDCNVKDLNRLEVISNERRPGPLGPG